jgi:hypothetical protein
MTAETEGDQVARPAGRRRCEPNGRSGSDGCVKGIGVIVDFYFHRIGRAEPLGKSLSRGTPPIAYAMNVFGPIAAVTSAP